MDDMSPIEMIIGGLILLPKALVQPVVDSGYAACQNHYRRKCMWGQLGARILRKIGVSTMSRVFYKYIPKPMKAAIRLVYWETLDALDVLAGRRDGRVPPRRLHFVGKGDFLKIGHKFKQLLIEIGGLKSTDKVLDVGCGVGRIAIPLTEYLSKGGAYEGFDVVPAGIRWCKNNITKEYPNFRFQVADLYNKTYNPTGKYAACEFIFPYADNTFDMVILTSVFTHLLYEDAAHYIAEVTRVLRPGGRCFSTFFLLNDESRRAIEEGRSSQLFAYDHKQCKVEHSDTPEDAVAYDEEMIRDMFSAQALYYDSAVNYGRWSGRTDGRTYQDLLVAIKKPRD